MQRAALLVSLLVPSLWSQEQVTWSVTAPPAPSSVGASANGARGGTTLYYWLIARYPGGASAATMAMAFSTVGGGNLSVSNFVRVSWAPAAGATGYDVLRSDTPAFPGPSCAACAVALNSASTTVDDNGGALSAYPPGGLNSAVPVTATLTINNRDASSPYVNLQLLSIRLNEVLRVGLISGTPAEDDCIKFAAGRLVSAGAACGSGGGGGGVSYPSQLGCSVTVVGDVMTIFAGATPSNPCNVAGKRYTAPETVTLGVSAPTGTYSFEFRYASGVMQLFCRPPTGVTATVTPSSSNIVVEPASGFSGEGTAFFTFDGGPSAWTTVTGVDHRSFLTTQNDVAAGSGLTCTKSAGLTTCSVNAAVIADLASVQTFTGRKTFSPTPTDAGLAVQCTTLPSSPVNGYIACDSADGNRVKIYSNGAWVAPGGSTCDTAYDVTNFGDLITHSTSYLPSTVGPMVRHWENTCYRTIKRVGFIVGVAGGAAESTRFGIYNPSCSTQVAVSDAFNGTGTGTQFFVFGSTFALPPGTYCVMVASNSATLTISHNFSHSGVNLNAVWNTTTTRSGYCPNAMSGSGASATLPSSCGTINSSTFRHFNFMGIPN